MLNRHEFLKSLAAAGTLAAVSSVGEMELLAQTPKKGGTPDLVAVMGGEPDQMYEAAIKAIGGLGRFVKKGQKVTIKPNIGWAKKPELAANTNPLLISTLVKACFAEGAAEVTVFDNTCQGWQDCYRLSGIKEAAEAAGAKVVPGNDERYFRDYDLPKGKVLQHAKIHQAILDCDVWINVPVMKNHGGANMTVAMKNHMGIVWDRRAFHSKGLPQCIADICTIDKPAALHIVDAYRIMTQNGPQGRSEADVATPKALFMSTDIVAVDTAAIRFFDQIRKMPLEDVPYLAMGQEHGLGSMDLKSLNIKRIKMN